MMGTLLSWRMERQTSWPYAPGSERSSRTQSGHAAKASPAAFANDLQQRHSCPLSLSMRTRFSRKEASSSTMNNRAIGPLPYRTDEPMIAQRRGLPAFRHKPDALGT